MLIWEGIGGVVLFLIAACVSIYFYGRMCRDVGYEEGRADRHAERLAEDRAARAGRHRMSSPRATPPPAPETAAPPEKPARAARARDDLESWYSVFHGTPSAATMPPVQTALLDPQPAPQLNGADDTGTMARVQLDMASTSEIRAITSAWIAENCPGAEEEAEALA